MSIGEASGGEPYQKRCKVWLPPSGETKLFISSRKLFYLTERASPKTYDYHCNWTLVLLETPFIRNTLTSLETMDSTSVLFPRTQKTQFTGALGKKKKKEKSALAFQK